VAVVDPRAHLREAVTHANYDRAPNQPWSFLHMREIVPSTRIPASGNASPLPRDETDLSELSFTHADRTYTIAQMMEQTFVDGLMVLRKGKVVFERYRPGMKPATTHILQSVSKTLAATLTGILIEQGRFALETTVPDIIPELVGTCWDGCTIQHLLDMRSGTAFDESDYEDQDSESYRGFRILGWLPRLPDDPSPTEYIAQMHNNTPHGGDFEYRSICTDVLGWCMERATGEPFAELYTREVWEPMGGGEADFLVGPGNFPLTSGGFCVTLQDLALFGQMWLRDGVAKGNQIVPRWWIDRMRTADQELIAAFAASTEGEGSPPQAFYHDQWWVSDAEAGIYAGSGIHGQQIRVHHPSNTVVARLSSWPRPWVKAYADLAEAGVLALCEAELGPRR
jgi:hypothetical protein